MASSRQGWGTGVPAALGPRGIHAVAAMGIPAVNVQKIVSRRALLFSQCSTGSLTRRPLLPAFRFGA